MVYRNAYLFYPYFTVYNTYFPRSLRHEKYFSMNYFEDLLFVLYD